MGLTLAPFFFTHGQTVSATSADIIQSDLSRLTKSLDLVNAIKAGKRPIDATALQTALNTVISISEEEVRSVSTLLAAHDGLSDDERAVRDSIITDIINLKSRIKSVRADTTQEAGASAVISIAQKFKEWRDGPYAATMARAVRFLGVFENENAIQAANARLAAIVKDEKKIRALLPGTKSAPFMSLRKKAHGELKKAADLNARAKAVIITGSDAEETEETQENDANADEMIRQSFTLVNAAYDDFIGMSKLIRK